MEFKVYFGNSQRRSRLVETLFHRARSLKLSCPLGRAVYLANRHFNGDYKPWGGMSRTFEADSPLMNAKSDERALRSVKLDTAKRWLAHYENGGSVKTLKRSAKEQAAFRRQAVLEHCARNAN